MGRLVDKNTPPGDSGIGLATAPEFDREVAPVANWGLNEGTLQATKETLGAGSLAVRAGVRGPPDLDTMFNSMRPLARARGGRQPRPSRPARPRSSISLESSAPNSWVAVFA